jgi:hypothetical protein
MSTSDGLRARGRRAMYGEVRIYGYRKASKA